MEFLDNKLEKKLLYLTNQYFPSHINKNGKIVKILNKPYSYWIDRTKIYIFENDELFNFLTWYWYNCKETFLIDFCNIDYEIPWKYFCEKIPNFKINYPSVDSYNSDIIEKRDADEIFDELIYNVGIDDFINNVILKKNKYKSMEFTPLKI